MKFNHINIQQENRECKEKFSRLSGQNELAKTSKLIKTLKNEQFFGFGMVIVEGTLSVIKSSSSESSRSG
jgi:hypothetical protein